MEANGIVDAIYAAKAHLGKSMGEAIPDTVLTKEHGDSTYMSNPGGSACTHASVWADIDPDDLDGVLVQLVQRQGQPPKVEYDFHADGIEFVWRDGGEKEMECHVVESNDDGTLTFTVAVWSGFRPLIPQFRKVDTFPPE